MNHTPNMPDSCTDLPFIDTVDFTDRWVGNLADNLFFFSFK